MPGSGEKDEEEIWTTRWESLFATRWLPISKGNMDIHSSQSLPPSSWIENVDQYLTIILSF